MSKILIVDDDQYVCEGVKSLIERIGYEDAYEILISTFPYEALDIYSKEKPSIVITDIKMPGMTGIELVRRLREKRYDTHYIILSGHSDYSFVRTTFKMGIVDYLLKPVDCSELSALLEKIKNKASKSEENNKYTSSVDLVKQYVENNMSRAISLREVADDVSLNYSYLSKLFKKETGMSFSKYVSVTKMKMACSLLQNPTNRITEIAAKLGYEDVFSFSRVFKRIYGYSPRDYRKQQHKSEP